ncbi:MAG: ATP-binding cassette domain-containing protein, partial [Bifidobacterium crudilactis]|nr:ATP-binding cassette domain-containing protein [Bifidobacterium crudilactis]
MNRETAQQHGTTTVDKTTAPRSEQQHDSAEEESASSLTFDHWGYKHASRRHFAVRDLNLHIRAGERVLLLGASGIGKSTILEGAAGLIGGQTTPTTPPEDSDSADNDASQRA